MKLLSTSSTNSFVSVSHEIEYMGDKFVLVTITVDIPAPEKSYLYRGGFQWRLYGEAEPLAVSLDFRDDISPGGGVLKEIRFFISETVTQEIGGINFHKKINGLPVLSLDNQETHHGYFHEEKGTFRLHLVDKSLYCLFENIESDMEVEINEHLSCLFDSEKVFSGFVIRNLVDEEINVIKEANLI